MSTGYYLVTKDKEFVKTYFDGEYSLTDIPFLGYEIYIGKRSGGWEPLFVKHTKAYQSVKEMLEFLQFHKDKVSIYDEYFEDEMTVEQLKEELVDWKKHQKVRYWQYTEVGIFDPVLQTTHHLVESTPQNCDIVSPFDHVEYAKLVTYNRIYDPAKYYEKDAEGFTFVLRGEV